MFFRGPEVAAANAITSRPKLLFVISWPGDDESQDRKLTEKPHLSSVIKTYSQLFFDFYEGLSGGDSHSFTFLSVLAVARTAVCLLSAVNIIIQQ